VRKPSYDKYIVWHRERLGDDLVSADLSAKFDANIALLHSTVNSHPFMALLAKRLAVLSDTGMFQENSKVPELVLSKKTFGSFSNKLFRVNCLWNRSWPENPQAGWINFSNAFGEIDDLIRTTLICRYLDGPELVSKEILAAAHDAGLGGDASPRATETGYYAWHAYVKVPAKVIIEDKVIDVHLAVEFQTTTQLQAALRELTHKFYEKDRAKPLVGRSQARWDYQSSRFRAEYLCHTLHLVDAMLVELRLAQEAENDGADSGAVHS
jgi:ppGpp synthetase/RelA/SpoT-type nucleotidyltranferase